MPVHIRSKGRQWRTIAGMDGHILAATQKVDSGKGTVLAHDRHWNALQKYPVGHVGNLQLAYNDALLNVADG